MPHSLKRIPDHQKKPRGDEAKTRRNRDGTWAKKDDEIHFGYKLHQKTDIDYGLMREIETTTASLHDSQVDLSAENEVVLRDLAQRLKVWISL